MADVNSAVNGSSRFNGLSYFQYAELTEEEVYRQLRTSDKGLSEEEAKRRLLEFGHNQPVRKKKRGAFIQFLSKFTNPLVLLLLCIAIVSFFFGEKISAVVVFLMALISGVLSFVQEYRAGNEADRLLSLVRTTAAVYRKGKVREISLKEIVPGDVIELSAGDVVPADVRVILCRDLFLDGEIGIFCNRPQSTVGISVRRHIRSNR